MLSNRGPNTESLAAAAPEGVMPVGESFGAMGGSAAKLNAAIAAVSAIPQVQVRHARVGLFMMLPPGCRSMVCTSRYHIVRTGHFSPIEEEKSAPPDPAWTLLSRRHGQTQFRVGCGNRISRSCRQFHGTQKAQK